MWPIKLEEALTYDVEHEVVSQAGGAVDADQDAILERGAKAHCQPVRTGARALVGRPVKGYEASSFPKNICCSSWKRQQENAKISQHYSGLDSERISTAIHKLFFNCVQKNLLIS